MNYRKIVLYTAASISVLTEWGCATRKYDRNQSVQVADAFRTDTAVTSYEDSSIASISYKEFFQEPELQRLIAKTVANNLDLQAAVKQIQIAEASMQQAKLGNLPTVTGTIASATIDRPSDKSLNGTMYSQFLGKKYLESYSTQVTVSWTADIWGKIKEQKKEALLGYLQTEEAKKAVQTQLVSAVANGYYNLLLLKEQLKITKENIALMDSTIDITKTLQSVGEVTSLAIQQQEAARQSAIASIPLLEQQIFAQENALSILSGETPQKIDLSGHLFAAALRKALPTGVPSYMVDNRPDVHQAELEILRSISAENIAHTSMYPQFTIAANGGLNANSLKDWFDIPGALFVNGLASISTPIFQAKMLKTRYEQSKIATDQSILKFKQSVLNALGDVSNALNSVTQLEKREQELDLQEKQLRSAVNSSTLLYQNGQASYLEVISAETNILQARLNKATVRMQRLGAVVALYQSLGGGWK